MPDIRFGTDKKVEFEQLWTEWVWQLPEAQGEIVRTRGIVWKRLSVDLNNPSNEIAEVQADLVDFLIKCGFPFAIV